jgi:hypothetical protein
MDQVKKNKYEKEFNPFFDHLKLSPYESIVRDNSKLDFCSPSEARDFLNENVFNHPRFKIHIQEVSESVGFSEEVVTDILTDYFTHVAYEINKQNSLIPKQKVKRVKIYNMFDIDIRFGQNYHSKSKKYFHKFFKLFTN